MLIEKTPSSSSIAKPAIDIFGCQASKLATSQELRGTGITFFRKASNEPDLGRIATDSDNRGYLLGVSQASGHRRRVFHASHATSHDFAENSIYVRNLADPYRADLQGSFDFLLMELSRSFMVGLADEHGWRNGGDLNSDFRRDDPILSSLMRAARPALKKGSSASSLFMDQLGIAVGVYLHEHYSGVPAVAPGSKRALLSRGQMALAGGMLRARSSGNVSIAELASACGLSRGYFIHAFKSTTGSTPHQWILAQRVAQARDLLGNSDLPLAEVALICGFADQSHFTRVFKAFVGVSPAVWRRTVKM
jgi:AraC family transcriptional regulator